MVDRAGALADRVWRRYDRKQRMIRYAVLLATVMVVYWAVRDIDIFWPWVWDAPNQISSLGARMWPPDPSRLAAIVNALLETVHIATLATALTIFIALPVSYIAAQNTTPNRACLWLGRFILVASRSVNTIIWALLFVAIFGPGVLAGILAIMFRSVGFIGKLMGEAIEEIDRRPVEAMEATGASKAKVIAYAIVPQVMPAFFAIVILRWDINIRESTVLGLVGAGGIGVILQGAIDTFAWPTVATILIAIVVLVLIGEAVTGLLRGKVL
ncbi:MULTISPECIES: phosphonate ABC transporter, permease protein PhnE [Halomonadaceae]|uniref:Phosphonate ABC transporter, permease protein PhnE n=2 Tax=Halomonadaceae TaxID=28256 RepID=A0ABS6ZT95_9GAMM|nr:MULTISPECIES: phosphonate ABC transporter, permease protein PhnE [Halomonas]MBW6393053.1 phosphonate ABC transporter, permease protein PhnE [Halomonas antri]QTP60873.1 phosphonate ABC transporter, permease protein PhnE [Halomonas sulfidivorans]